MTKLSLTLGLGWVCACAFSVSSFADEISSDAGTDQVTTAEAAPTEDISSSVANAPESFFRGGESGAYVALDGKLTSLADSTGNTYGAFLLGGRMAWVVNQELSFGAAAYHVMNDVNSGWSGQNSTDDQNEFGGPSYNSSKPWRSSLPLAAGV